MLKITAFLTATGALGAIHSTKFPEHFHPPFEVDHFSHSDRSEILVEWIAPSIFIIFG